MAHKHSAVESLEDYFNTIKGIKLTLAWSGTKTSASALKENLIDAVFLHRPHFKEVFHPALASHINSIFEVLGSITRLMLWSVSSASIARAAGKLTKLGSPLLELLVHSVLDFPPLFTKSQITPYIHFACVHLGDLPERHGSTPSTAHPKSNQ